MKYYIAENGQPAGPFEIAELLNHGLTVNSQVWCETMDNWQPAGQVPELLSVLQPTQQPVQQDAYPQQANQQPAPQGSYQQPAQQPVQQGAYQQPMQQPYGGYAQPQYQAPYQVMPKNWMTEAVLLTVLSVICCCNPFSLITGIIAMVNAGKVKSAYTVGNMPEALQASKSARMWTLITLGVMLLGIIVGTIIMMNTPQFAESFSEAVSSFD